MYTLKFWMNYLVGITTLNFTPASHIPLHIFSDPNVIKIKQAIEVLHKKGYPILLKLCQHTFYSRLAIILMRNAKITTHTISAGPELSQKW